MKQENIPLVSILIPTYDQKPEYLRATIQSALQQKYPNLEIIISDNHCGAETTKVMEEFSDPRLRIVKPEKHISLNDNFNFAASNAKGEYISFLSSDDLIYKDCIEKTMQPLLANKQMVFAYNENDIIDANGNLTDVIRHHKLPTGTYSAKHIALRMLNNTEYWVIGGIVKKEAFMKEKFVDPIRAADWVLGFKLLKYGNVGYVNETLSAIRIHERTGAKGAEYEVLKKEHFKQLIPKFGTLIEDTEFLKAVELSKEELIKQRDEEIIVNIIILLRKVRAGEVDLNFAMEIISEYKKHSKDKFIIKLEKNFTSTYGLLLTYSSGFRRRLKRSFLKMNTKHIY